MFPFRTILVAADFSESSQEAFRIACALSRADETRLVVLHVLESLHIAEQPVYFGEQTVLTSNVERDPGYDEAVTERLREFYVPDQPVETHYRARKGDPAEETLRVAEEVGSDLIVMGTHGRSGLGRLLAGSVAEAVLRKARCPVLALRSRPRDARPASKKSAASAFRLILHPTDFSDDSDAALRVARSLARDHGARLLILHTIPLENIPSEVPLIRPIDYRAFRAALEEKRSEVEGPEMKFAARTELTDGVPAEEILRVARESECDLIVMGTHGRGGLGRLLMGSVAEAVQRRSECPVVTVKYVHPLATLVSAEQSTAG